jgi:hypothetical protein
MRCSNTASSGVAPELGLAVSTKRRKADDFNLSNDVCLLTAILAANRILIFGFSFIA